MRLVKFGSMKREMAKKKKDENDKRCETRNDTTVRGNFAWGKGVLVQVKKKCKLQKTPSRPFHAGKGYSIANPFSSDW